VRTGEYHRPMSRPAPDPLEGTARLFVDGTNLLHALGRARGGPPAAGAQADGAPLPAAALVGRLRALVPAATAVTIVLDGMPAPGAIGRRVTSGVEVRYAGSRPADILLHDLTRTTPEPDLTLVVTDDAELGRALRALGARTARASWLVGRLARQRLSAPAAGRPGPPDGRRTAAGPGGDAADGEGDARRWKPGRGATKKTGNPKRGHPRGQ
jgi:hypothetical protein